MTLFESFVVDGFGLAIVFTVLIALSLIIKLISMIFAKGQKKTGEAAKTETAVQPHQQYGEGELKLIDVDERTAAAVMAIVSKKTEIPLPRLRFNSIRRVK